MKLSTTLKAEAVALALYRLTGSRPIIESVGDTARVYWLETDLPMVRAWFEKQVQKSSVPPDVSIDLMPVVAPFASRTAAPAVLITLAVGVLLGRYL